MDPISVTVKKLMDDTNLGVYIMGRDKLIQPYYSISYKDNYCGVYWLYDGDEIVYIGFSEDLLTRLKSHARSRKKWYRAKSVIINDPKIARSVESTLLLNFATRYNSPKNRMAYRERMDKGLPVAIYPYKNFKNHLNRMIFWFKYYEGYSREELMVFGIGIADAFDRKDIYIKYADVTYEEYEKNFKLRLLGEKQDMYMV